MSSRVDFYNRLIALLEKRGFKREPYQTPLEFAESLNMAEAFELTRLYNRIRFGADELSRSEAETIVEWLNKLESQS